MMSFSKYETSGILTLRGRGKEAFGVVADGFVTRNNHKP
jgi:hypothetical protein